MSSKPQATVPLSVRVPPKIQEAFSQFSKNSRLSQGEIMSAVLENFFKLNADQQEALLLKPSTNFFETIGTCVRLIAWGDHASRQQRGHVWAIEAFTKLIIEVPEIEEVQLIALYKCGRLWMDFSDHLYEQAQLEDSVNGWGDHMKASMEALLISIAYHRRINTLLRSRDGGEHPPTLYNEACAWSMLAARQIEASKPRPPKSKRPKPPQPQPDAETPSLRGAPAEVGTALENAMRCLLQMQKQKKATLLGPPEAEIAWLSELAETDADLELLRAREGPAFVQQLRQRPVLSRVLAAFAYVKERIPDEIRAKFEELQQGAAAH